jgi:UTP:GlnB (protein PII) uridylyltransferase
MFDDPEILMEMVTQSGAQSTQPVDAETIQQLYAKCKPIADKWKPVADELWEEYQR